MKYTFSLEESDYLTHQLFVVSTSKPAVWRRRRSWILITLAFLCLAWVFQKESNEFLRNYFIGISIISLIFYPFYSRWRYKKHYSNHINENLSQNFGKEVTIEFLDEHFLTQDAFGSESKISYSQVQSFNELPEHFLVRLNNSQSLILPKNKTEPIDELRRGLTELASKLGFNINDNTSWKWK